MIASTAAVLLATAVAAIGLRLTGTPWVDTAKLLAALVPLAAASLAVAHLSLRLPLRPALTRHFAGAAMAGAAIVASAVVVGVELMFVSRHDRLIVLVIVAFSMVVALRVAAVLAAAAAERMQRLRAALATLPDGGPAEPVPESGPRELAQLAEAANRLTRDLHRANADAAASDSARRALVAGVSHDLRSPIAAMQLLTEAIADGVAASPGEVADYHRQLHGHLRHLSGLVDDLFELARMDAGDVAWRTEPLPVVELIEETVDAFRPAAADGQIALAEHVADGTPPVAANPEKLQRVLFNLVQNAVRHTPPGGSVTLVAAPAEDAVRFEVRDTGPGVPPDEAELVFDRFFRGGSTSSRTDGGSGLGLAIARSIVEAHRGRIWIESPGPRGATFAFTIPAARTGAG